MPVCLDCGIEIEAGSNFCEDCRLTHSAEVLALMELSKRNPHSPRGPRRIVWLTIITIVLFGTAVAVAFGLLSMIPSNPRFQGRAQANLCHRNLVDIQDAVDSYYRNAHQYPPTGRLSAQNPLVLDRYLQGVPHCPSTGHTYIIRLEPDSGTYTVVCDSGLAGHAI